jgi:hypothetical protein
MILLVLGILVAGAGIGAIGFEILANEISLRSALISAGTSALTGGLNLIALAAVISELKRLREILRARPAARPARPSADVPRPGFALGSVAATPPVSPHSAPGQVSFPMHPKTEGDLTAAGRRQPAYSTVDASTADIEPLRSTIPRTNHANPEPALANEVPLTLSGSGQQSRRIRTPTADNVVEAKLEDEVRPMTPPPLRSRHRAWTSFSGLGPRPRRRAIDLTLRGVSPDRR